MAQKPTLKSIYMKFFFWLKIGDTLLFSLSFFSFIIRYDKTFVFKGEQNFIRIKILTWLDVFLKEFLRRVMQNKQWSYHGSIVDRNMIDNNGAKT